MGRGTGELPDVDDDNEEDDDDSDFDVGATKCGEMCCNIIILYKGTTSYDGFSRSVI